MKAMIFAAGIGSRLRPVTDTRPKALVEVGGKTMLEHSILYLKKHGFDDIIINLHHFPEQIKSFLEKKKYFGIDITISDERDKLLDTGGGLKKVSWFFNDQPFLLYNVDILTNLDLNEFTAFHRQNNGMATLAVRERSSSRYLLFDEAHKLIGWENTQTREQKILEKTNLIYRRAFSGIHMINPSFFNKLPQKKTFSIIEAYLGIAKNTSIYGFTDNHSYWFDIGSLEKLEKARIFMNSKTK